MFLNDLLETFSFIFIILAISFFPLKNEIKIFNKKFHKIFLSNIFFYFGNLFSMFFAILNGFLPLFIQIVIFQYFSIKGIQSFNRRIKIFYFVLFNIALIFFSLFFINFNNLNFNITVTEIIAAVIAIIGTFYMNILKKLKVSFFLYIIADSIYFIFFLDKKIYIFSFLYFIFIIINILSFLKEK